MVGVSSNVVQDLLNEHARRAAASEYDRATCIASIAAARDAVAAIHTAENASYGDAVIQQLSRLADGGTLPGGEYVSGRSIVIALLDDIRLASD